MFQDLISDRCEVHPAGGGNLNRLKYKMLLAVALTIAAMVLSGISPLSAQPYQGTTITVAQDGSGEFTSIQAAIDAIRDFTPEPVKIIVRNGVYYEKVTIPHWKTDITLSGESRDSTIISWSDYSGKGSINTFTSYTVRVVGDGFTAENITFVNSAGPVGQAVALHVEGDRCVFRNCRIIGNQDSLFASGKDSRQYYENCYIEGTTDFIFGSATAVFTGCTIHSKKNSYITAASTTPAQAYGFVFFDCRLTAAPEAEKVYLGRPWRDHARTVFINCEMGAHIRPEGWNNWGRPGTEKTSYYAEYASSGPGAASGSRASWTHQLDENDLDNYTLDKIFTRKDKWLPGTPGGLRESKIGPSGSFVPAGGNLHPAQHPVAPGDNYISSVWVADQGDGTYINPILHADYSDPDVIRAGEDYYMTASSFNSTPGLPVLHSRDLVNWRLIGHALPRQQPDSVFGRPQHGNGVWAPAIRYHKGEFYIYYGDPDFGIYMVKSKDPAGPWDPPVLVRAGKGLIDPCPFWDQDGKAWLVHAWAGSRAGIKSVLTLNRMSEDGTRLLDEGVIVFDGHRDHPTVEGPKMYKRNGYYYIFAPAGGVATGWQLVLRSKNIYGPYQEKIVMAQGDTEINGPHQGGWVETPGGESWFIHFQDKEAYGRIVHLQPMKWTADWPVIGIDKDGDGTGEPVMSFAKPEVDGTYPVQTPVESDEFNAPALGLQWQWHANPQGTWAFPDAASGNLRLFSAELPESMDNYWDVPSLLLQKFPAEAFQATTSLRFYPQEKLMGERVGFIVMGASYAYLSLVKKDDGLYLCYTTCEDAENGDPEKETVLHKLEEEAPRLYFRVEVGEGAECRFSYSLDGEDFQPVGETFTAQPGKWIGAKLGLFCTRPGRINDSGYADVDWFRITPLNE